MRNRYDVILRNGMLVCPEGVKRADAKLNIKVKETAPWRRKGWRKDVLVKKRESGEGDQPCE